LICKFVVSHGDPLSKYRPQNFLKSSDKTHRPTLSNSIKNNRIGHAFLFTGHGEPEKPRWPGYSPKRQLHKFKRYGRVRQSLASAEPCLKCENCKNIQDGRSLDIIEIDAASNTGVDNIRELRETVKLLQPELNLR